MPCGEMVLSDACKWLSVQATPFSLKDELASEKTPALGSKSGRDGLCYALGSCIQTALQIGHFRWLMHPHQLSGICRISMHLCV